MKAKKKKLVIAVLQRGWVAVGRLTRLKNEEMRLDNAAIIRRWGTTKGLPELASSGPSSNTALDESPPIRYHKLTEVLRIDCEESKWRGR